MTYPPTPLHLPTAGQAKAVSPSRAYRRHMHGLDFCQAVHDATDTFPDFTKARCRLSSLIAKASTHIGPKDNDGRWVFASEDHRRQYGRSLSTIMELTEGQGKDVQDGYVWFVLALGWAEDCHDYAEVGGKHNLAHCWRLICRVLGWMYGCYEGSEGEAYQHGVKFLQEMQEATVWT